MKIAEKTIEYLIKAIRFLSIHRIAAFIILFVFFYLPVGVILGEFAMPVPYFLRKAVQVRTAEAASAGPRDAGTDATTTGTCNDNMTWTGTGSPGGTNQDDGSYVQTDASKWDAGQVADGIYASNFGFTLPSVDSVDGIVIDILAWVTTGTAGTWTDVVAGTVAGTRRGEDQADIGGNPAMNLAEAGGYITFGASDNDWYAGGSWTQAEINAIGFGVEMCVTANAANSVGIIDHVRATVYYTEPVVAVTYVQNNFRFYLDNDLLTPTEPWGNPDIGEKSIITVLPISNDAPASGSQMRLRFNILVGGGELAATTQAFRFKYVAGDDCPNIASTSFSDVGASTSNEIWRFADGWTDGATLLPFLLSDSTETASGAYMESNPSTTNPVAIQAGEYMEWDASLQNNGAADATKYCFRLQLSDEADLDTYNTDSFPAIETAPVTADLMRHGNFFASEAEKGFFWAD